MIGSLVVLRGIGEKQVAKSDQLLCPCVDLRVDPRQERPENRQELIWLGVHIGHDGGIFDVYYPLRLPTRSSLDNRFDQVRCITHQSKEISALYRTRAR